MKKNVIMVLIFWAMTGSVLAQKADTLVIGPTSLKMAKLNIGNRAYIVYNKKTKDSPSEKIVIVKIGIKSVIHNGRQAISINQRWEMDTVVHTAYTILNPIDFSTLQHNFYWKRLGYASKYDFTNKNVSFEGYVPDSAKSKSIEDFKRSFNSYNLNWHSDLIIFPLLPLKENMIFKINFYDPGFGQAKEVLYTVIGTEVLFSSSGEKIDCWILEHKLSESVVGYQKFWISKNANEVVKEEDLFNGRYRYKIKLSVSEKSI